MSNLIEQIKAAFERDQQQLADQVTTAEQIPLRYEAITDEWLSAVLCRNTPGALVTGHRLGAPDDGTSNRRAIGVEYNDAGTRAGLPTALVCKATQGLSNRMTLGLSGAAFSEVTFYNHIRALLDIEAPECFHAALDAHSFNSIVVLRELPPQTRFCTHETPISRARVENQLAVLAVVHGSGYSNAALRAQLPLFTTWPEYFGNTLLFGLKEGSERGFLAAEAAIPPRLYRRHAEIWPATLASVEANGRLPYTLAHGDVHLKNWYLTPDGRMGLADWQCVSRGHWSRDVAYAVATALTVEHRRAWERELLRDYLDRLHAAGGPRVGFDDAWTCYRQQLMSALTWWTVTLTPAAGMPDMQPRDITLEFIRRIATAMDDVDSLASF